MPSTSLVRLALAVASLSLLGAAPAHAAASSEVRAVRMVRAGLRVARRAPRAERAPEVHLATASRLLAQLAPGTTWFGQTRGDTMTVRGGGVHEAVVAHLAVDRGPGGNLRSLRVSGRTDRNGSVREEGVGLLRLDHGGWLVASLVGMHRTGTPGITRVELHDARGALVEAFHTADGRDGEERLDRALRLGLQSFSARPRSRAAVRPREVSASLHRELPVR